MGSAASTHGLFNMSVSQINLDDYSESEIQKTLESLNNENLIRFLNLYNCQTVRIKRKALSGRDLLYMDEEELIKLNLVSKIHELIIKFRKEMRIRVEAREEEMRIKYETEEAARIERNKREHEEMLRSKGIGEETMGTSRELSVKEKKRKAYVRSRTDISQRSEATIEIHQMEKRLQTMLSRPNSNVYDTVTTVASSSSISKNSIRRSSSSTVESEMNSQSSSLLKNDLLPNNPNPNDSSSSPSSIANNSQDEIPPSLSELAAMDWCELQRNEYLLKLDRNKKIFINDMNEMQLQLSRSNDIHALHARTKLMKLLGNKLKNNDLRIAKQYAGNGPSLPFWSESDNEDDDNDSLNVGTDNKKQKKIKNNNFKIMGSNEDVIPIPDEISSICPDIEDMYHLHGKKLRYPPSVMNNPPPSSSSNGNGGNHSTDKKRQHARNADELDKKRDFRNSWMNKQRPSGVPSPGKPFPLIPPPT